jgi:hypothetical protein
MHVFPDEVVDENGMTLAIICSTKSVCTTLLVHYILVSQ